MQSNSEGYFDIIDLAKELRSEKLFIQSEIEAIRRLNEKLEKSAVKLAQATWTSTQQRSNVKQLFAQGDPSSSTCCQRIDFILSPEFVDAHKVLRYQDTLVLSDLIQRVRTSPSIASLWLAAAELKRPAAAAAVARVLCGGLFVCDVSPLRRILYHLAKHRLAVAEDPRRIISQGSSSFSRLYCELVDGFRPARLFLAAALKGPMLPLLQIDECLVIDPDKALERVKKFFKNSNPNIDWQHQLARYRKWTVSTLVISTGRFISSLRELWMCFPPTIAWVIRQTALTLQTNQTVSEEDVHYICTDLVFTNFICQAIINPEAYGITDIPITNISRFNLVQVAQTIQTLCLMKYQEVDGKFRDFYLRFEKDSVYSLVDILLENESYSVVPNDNSGYNSSESGDMEDGISEGAVCESEERDVLKKDPIVNPNIALFTRSDLHLLVSLLKVIPNSGNGLSLLSEQITNMKTNGFMQETVDKKNENHQKLSDIVLNQDVKCFDDLGTHSDNDTACGTSSSNTHSKIENSSLDFTYNEEFSSLLKNTNPDLITKLQKLLEKLPDSSFNWENSSNSKVNGSSVSKGKCSTSNSPVKNGPKKRKSPPQSQEVLIIKLPGDSSYEPIGLVSENKVLEYHYSTMGTCRTLSEEMLQQDTGLPNSRSMELLELPRPDAGTSTGTSHNNQSSTETSGPHPQEKRTRFSLSHDEGSIGNTSDNLEAVSEAASNHSVTSSLEMETEDQNDNLSDMVSANVSGRGSPNISGRDTPSSQVTEGDAGAALANPQPLRHPSVTFSSSAASKQAKLLKRTRHDIEDKFCKFEIKKLIEGDETISIISDTWSTDVLASDSETIGEYAYDRSFIATHFGQNTRTVGHQTVPTITPPQPDVSETASESAWSTDVLVSDADRMTEVDIDDCNSVARSDITDTARSEGDAPSAPITNNSQPSHQLSPVNTNRNASCNRKQIRESSFAGTSGAGVVIMNGLPNNIPLTETNASIEHVVNFSLGENVSPLILITENRILESLINGENNSSNYDIVENGVSSINVPETFETENTNGDNKNETKGGDIERNGYKNFSLNMNSEMNVDNGVQYRKLENDSSNNGTNSYKFVNGQLLNNSDLLEFDSHRKGIINDSTQNIKQNSVNSLSDGFTEISPFTHNGSATIRWLNDPCQKFPLCPDAEQSSNSQFFDYDPRNFSSCSESINSFCKKVENINLNQSDSNFRPIKSEEKTSTKKQISKDDLRNCNAGFIDEDKMTNHKIGNQYVNAISTTSSESEKTPPPMINDPNIELNFVASASCKTKDHNSTATATKFKLIETSNSNSLNITPTNKQAEKSVSKSNDEKTDSPLNDVISSSSAISLSTLSVNSVDTSTSDKSSSQEVNSENLTERRITPPLGNNGIVSIDLKNQHVSIVNDGANTLPRQSCALGTSAIKPGSSTGAIPKSISFDSTAEKTHRYHSGRRIVDDASDGISINFGELKNNVKRSGGNFLNKIKLFRNKSRGPSGAGSNFGKRSNQDSSEDLCRSGRDSEAHQSAESNRNDGVNLAGNSVNSKSNMDLSDDILAKYRRKASSSSDAANSDSTSHSGSTRSRNRGTLPTCEDTANVSDVDSALDRNSDVEFESLRKELRIVLSDMEVHNIELAAGRSGSLALACALRLQGAGGALGAMSALGNLGTIDSSRGPSLLNALRADSMARRPYISYLAKCRRSLLSTIATIESECDWQSNEAERQGALAISARARTSLNAREPRLAALQEKLRSGLVDERREALAAALHSLASDMAVEEAWSGASEKELEQAALTIERVVMGRVYMQAMFPNGDGDIMRDQLLHEHMAKLGANGVELPARRLIGAPWTPAQRILAHLSAYKTPRDKVDCVVRCVNSIMTLLSMSVDRSAPGADDLTPVLVYILVKANPPSLLSTVQYVSTFINSPLEGEKLYCWTQFCAAIEYIKTMD